MSQVVVFGATGYAGKNIVEELVSRGHAVTAVARDVSAVSDGVVAQAGSIFDGSFVREVANGADHLVVAVKAFPTQEGAPALREALPGLIEAAVDNQACLSFVGGAGSLKVTEGGPLLNETPQFPEQALPESRAHGEILDALRASDESLDWFYVSPGATFGSWNPGERTGQFRIGKDVLLSDNDGVSAISGADLAIAYVNEIEDRQHRRERFTVSY